MAKSITTFVLALLLHWAPSAHSQDCIVSPPGLVGWWTGDNHSSDTTTHQNHGTPHHISYAEGKVQSGFEFNGTDSAVVIPQSESLTVGNLSFTAWIYPTDVTLRPVLEYGDENDWAGVHLWVGTTSLAAMPGALYANVRVGPFDNYVIEAQNVISENEWSFVALTYDQDSGVARLYVNGDIVKEANLGTFTPKTSAQLNIGQRSLTSRDGSNGRHFEGTIDEVGVYNRALTASEISTIFQAGSAGLCRPESLPCEPAPQGLVGWWSGDDHSDDLTGNQNHATLNSVEFTEGKVDSGFQFDGASSVVHVPPSSSLAVQSLTFDAWIFPTKTSLSPIIEYGNEGEPAGPHFWVGTTVGSAAAGSLYANMRVAYHDDHVIEVPNAIPPDQWSFVAVTYDNPSGVARLYINGEMVKESNLGSLLLRTADQRVQIGQRTPTSPDGSEGSTFGGILDEVEIYSRALTGEEIAAIYMAGEAGKCKPETVPCEPAPPGLVGWWSGDKHASDLTLNQNDGTLQDVAFDQGKVDHGFQLNGTSSAIHVPPSSSLAVQSLTFDAWIYPTKTSLSPIIEYGNEGEPAGPHFWVGTTVGSAAAGSLYANMRVAYHDDHVIEVPNAIPPDQWSFVAVTYDNPSGIARLYINGEMVKESNLGSLLLRTADQRVQIGQRTPTSPDGSEGSTFGGKIDEVEIYNRALSEEEIAAIYAAGSFGKCKPELPLVSIRFIPDSSEQPWPDADFAPGTVEIRRSGPTDAPLEVTYSLSGTATPGEDYQELPQPIVIPEGEEAVIFQVTAIDDELPEGSENIILTLTRSLPGAEYYIDSTRAQAEVTIIDNEPVPVPRVVLAVEVVDPIAGEHTPGPDPGRILIKRVDGPLNVLVAARIALSGTAQNGVDYQSIPNLIYLPAGVRSAQVVINALPDHEPEQHESVIVTLLEGPCSQPESPDCYLLGSPISGTVMIHEPISGNLPPTARIITPQNGSVFVQGQPIEIRAEASDPDGQIVRLELFANGLPIGMANGPVLERVWTGPVGEHTLTARAFDNRGGASVSTPVRILVRSLTGFVTRDLPSAYTPGGSFLVALRAHPPFGTSAYAIEDLPPEGWPVTDISHNGAFDEANGKVKFGPFTDAQSRTLTYRVTAPGDASGPQEFEGFSAISGQGYPIGGDQIVQSITPHHPADSNSDFAIVLLELASYAAAWKEGQRENSPAEIPLSYVTRAALLWKSGEVYEFDPSAGEPPFSWVPAVQSQMSALAVASAERTIDGDLTSGAALTVTLSVAPPAGASGYAVEEKIPAGWSVISVSHQGAFDPATSTIRWGLFMDSNPRQLTYTLTVPTEIPAGASLSGKVSFDGSVQDVTGAADLALSEAEVDVWFDSIESAAQAGMRLRISGPPGQICVFETSTDLENWEELATTFLPDGSLDYLDETAEAGSNRYYRVRVR